MPYPLSHEEEDGASTQRRSEPSNTPNVAEQGEMVGTVLDAMARWIR